MYEEVYNAYKKIHDIYEEVYNLYEEKVTAVLTPSRRRALLSLNRGIGRSNSPGPPNHLAQIG